jgi:6-phosphogluconolactonase
MNSEVRIFNDIEFLSRAAAHLFIEQAAQAITERHQFLVALNGGNTPTRLFQLLASDYREKIDWSRTHIFWGDERCVPPEDKESSYGQTREILLSKIQIPDSNVHRVNTDLEPETASKDYANTLSRFAQPPLEWPRFDLVLLGMGEDGHTASLFPGSPIYVTEPTLAVTGNYQDRPANRVTMTPLVFNSARMVIFMATGANKAVTLSRVLSDKYEPENLPAQRIEPKDGSLIWLLDEDAASKLSNKAKGLKFCEG